jgi:protein-tyrosine-phosphatase
MFNILVLCTANICRSPLGEAIFNHYVSTHGLEKQISVKSAGIWATDGYPVSTLAIAVAKENGIDVSKHLSRSITPEMINSSDLILCMTPAHKKELLLFFPKLESKIFALKEYGHKKKPQKLAIDDPIGMNLNFYRRIYSEIDTEIKRILPLIKGITKKE